MSLFEIRDNPTKEKLREALREVDIRETLRKMAQEKLVEDEDGARVEIGPRRGAETHESAGTLLPSCRRFTIKGSNE